MPQAVVAWLLAGGGGGGCSTCTWMFKILTHSLCRRVSLRRSPQGCLHTGSAIVHPSVAMTSSMVVVSWIAQLCWQTTCSRVVLASQPPMIAVDYQGIIWPGAQSLGARCQRGVGMSSRGCGTPRWWWSQSPMASTLRPLGTSAHGSC